MSKRYSKIEEVSCVEYHDNFLPDEIFDTVYNNIMDDVDFLSDEKSAITMMGKRICIPRKQCGYGD